MHQITTFLQRLLPALTPVSNVERLRAACGAGLGLFLTGFITQLALGPVDNLVLLVAPMGASSVLLFAVPSSPLAQPWSIIGGNLVAGLVGVTAAAYIQNPYVAAGVAGGVAIGLMLVLRCLHPPSGAVALTAVLGGPAVHALGYQFVLWPVGLNSVLLLACALVYNNLTGRRYPHLAPRATVPGDVGRAQDRVGFSAADLDAVLQQYGEVMDIDRNALETILRQAQTRGYRRRTGEITCGDIMTRNVLAVSPETPLRAALDLLRGHHIKALPVTDEQAHVVGIVTQTDLLDKADWGRNGPHIGLAQRLRQGINAGRAPDSSVADIMTAPVRSARPDTPIANLIPMMLDAGLHHLPVIDTHLKLVGIVTQTDLIAALFYGNLAGRLTPSPAVPA
ncbi:HPP family protein [Xanthobacter sp. DSM 24535]|uniref:HPP family protein n=1 Tax=Roseixanthobacter psychrophilus TaxID=3119917 RepID=UPI0037270763